MAAAADRDVTIDILARDKTERATRAATKNFSGLQRQVSEYSKQVKSADSGSGKFAKTLFTVAKAAGKVAAGVAGAVSLVGPLTTGVLAAAKATVVLGHGLAGLAPALAILPAIAGGLGLIKLAAVLIGPALAKALSPIKAAFFDADGNATKLTKHIQQLAVRGVQPLARELLRLDLPTVKLGLERIAKAANGVFLGVGNWLKTTEGQQLVRDITQQTAAASERLAPHVTAAAIALGRLATKGSDPGIKGLGDLIGRILDRFTAWANSTTIDDIKASLSDFSALFGRLRDGYQVLRDVGQWMQGNQGKVKSFSNTLAAAAIAVGAATGNLPALILGAFSLLANNWDEVKVWLAGVKSWWSETWYAISHDANVTALAAAVRGLFGDIGKAVGPAMQQFREQVGPAFEQLGITIRTKLLPALTDFITAARPWVAWFVEHALPQVVAVITFIVEYLSGVVTVVAGVLTILSGLLSGDWSKIWKGVKEIFAGWGMIIQAAIKGFFTAVFNDWSGFTSALGRLWEVGIVKWLGNKVAALVGWFQEVGRSFGKALGQGISDSWGAVQDALSGLLGKAKSAIPSALRGAFGFRLDVGVGGWHPAQAAAAFAGGGSFATGTGGGRVGGPTPVSVSSRVEVSLDGQPFRNMTARSITDAEKRTAWRERVGRR
jgi:hypothetical protein